jgi:hypothetical protein
MASDSRYRKVFLLGTISVLHEHLTRALCDEVFSSVRDKERQRKWTLYALAKFWTEVTLRAPKSLSNALREDGQEEGGYPQVDATPEAFFEKSASLRPGFFAAIFQRFQEAAVSQARRVFASRFSALDSRFTEIWAIDGSRLAAVWHRLKKLWKVPNVILPGALLALYDIRRGILRHLHYTTNAAKSESVRALEAIADIPAGALIVADRLFAVMKIFAAVSERNAWILAKRNKTVRFRRKRLLSKGLHEGGRWKEYEVNVGGTTKKTPVQTWRYFRWNRGSTTYELVTNILDQRMLSAVEALELYHARWSIERMFYDLKEVLNLNCIYASNANAVAQQVYACAIVHTALRITQGHAASELGIEPEELSVPKFFPRVVSASIKYLHVTLTLQEVVELNPGKELLLPDVNKMSFAYVALEDILVEKRSPRRRKRPFSAERKRWNSYQSVPGLKKLPEN